MQIVYRSLDVFFLVFHTAFTVFNMFGWISIKTRKVHCATMLITGCSWFILGIWYGWGYCFCTDWHWQVREKLGYPVLFNSYIQFMVHEITGYVPDANLTDTVVASVYFLCLFITVLLNIRDYWNAHRIVQ
ncbi:MAG: DUF2784 domain-containing protein [Spirochaetes bacterium]|nr:DUF2784 domain-containing protein [Spirochaetota bacterium]